MPDPGDPVGTELGLREVRSFAGKIRSLEIKTKETDRQERGLREVRSFSEKVRSSEIKTKETDRQK